jgi:hypothetical protein
MSKTITDIIPPSRRRQMEGGMGEPYQSPHTPNTPPPQRPFREKPASRGGFPYGTAAVALILIVGSLVVLASFTNAKVIVIPSSTSASIAGDEFTSTFTSGDLPYETVTVTKTVSGTVPAESTETVNDPAQGPITIYNAQSNPQTLIKNTRFASADGHVFRIHDSVSVPAGSATAPGSVQVVAYADVGGDSYNIPATTFTVPGLSGSKAFTLVTAKSAAPMTGGFSGSRPSVSQATRDAQNQKNQAALLKSMTDDASAKLDAGYVIISGGTFPTYVPQSDTTAKDGQVNVNLQGTLVAVAFPEASLAKAIASKIIGSYSGQPVHIENTSALTLSPDTAGKAPVNDPIFSFKLSGPVTIVWNIDTKKIAGAVAGKTRESANVILTSFPEVKEATLQVQPFWKQTFPEDPNNIKVSTSSAQTK